VTGIRTSRWAPETDSAAQASLNFQRQLRCLSPRLAQHHTQRPSLRSQMPVGRHRIAEFRACAKVPSPYSAAPNGVHSRYRGTGRDANGPLPAPHSKSVTAKHCSRSDCAQSGSPTITVAKTTRDRSHRKRTLNTIIRILLAAAILAVPSVLQAPAAAADTPSIHDPRYFAGVNVPYYNYSCDFGCASDTTRSSPPCQWGCGTGQGVSAPAVNAAIAGRFRLLQAANVHSVRWFMSGKDPWQINRDDSGPTSLNANVYTDLDAALALAERYDLAYNLVLFEGPSRLPRAWLEDATQRQRLADALAPLFERYRDNPHILAWEIFNEPDAFAADIPLEPIRQTTKLLVSTVRAHTGNLVTVGTAHADNIWQTVGLGLDFYQAHWYPHLDSGPACLPCTNAAAVAKLNHTEEGVPIVVGEFNDLDQLQRLRDLRSKGFAGAWAFSLIWERSGPDGANFQADVDALRTFTQSGAADPQGAAPLPADTAPQGGGS
jgi:hypothetical protein